MADTSFDMELYQKNRPKMAVLMSDDYMDLNADEGQKISLEFTVENQSEMAWPFKPLVQNEREKEFR